MFDDFSRDPRRPSSQPCDVPPGAPAWVTRELIERTIRVWQPYYKAILSSEDALAMILNVGRLWGVLSRAGEL
jgi:hypothetical protein